MTQTAVPTGSRRRRQLSTYVVLLLALSVIGAVYAAFAPSTRAAPETDQSLAVREGRALYQQGCATCHGPNGEGTAQAPTLIGVGAAAVDFQVGTGRMPLAAYGAQAERKPPRYTQAEIDQMAAFVDSLGGGPPVPTVNLADGDLTLGGELFRTNCSSCHNFAGSGGALTYGKYAPNLREATPVQVAEAIRTGPESMPVFGPQQFDQHQLNSIVKYVNHVTEKEPNPGGFGLGRYGPVPEGMLMFLVAIPALLALTLWIGARA